MSRLLLRIRSGLLLQCVLNFCALSFSHTSIAATTYFGYDYLAIESSPRPQSDAAAAAFDAATTTSGEQNLINFEAVPLGSFTSINAYPGVTLTGSYPNDYAGAPSEIRNQSLEPGNARRGYNTSVGGRNFNQVYGGNEVFDFSTPIIGFGLYISGLQNYANLTFNDGIEQSISFETSYNGGLIFVGFTNVGKPLSRVKISFAPVLGEPDSFGIDDVRFITAVPEVGTRSLYVFGLFLLLAMRSCRKWTKKTLINRPNPCMPICP